MLGREQIKIGEEVALTAYGISWEVDFSEVSREDPMYGTKHSCFGRIVGIIPNKRIDVRWLNGARNSYGPGHLTLTSELKSSRDIVSGDVLLYNGKYRLVLCSCSNGPAHALSHHLFKHGPANGLCKVCGHEFYYSDSITRSEKDCTFRMGQSDEITSGSIIPYNGVLRRLYCMCNVGRIFYLHSTVLFTNGPAKCMCKKCEKWFTYDPTEVIDTLPQDNREDLAILESFNNPMAALRGVLKHDPYRKNDHAALMAAHWARAAQPQKDLESQVDKVFDIVEIRTHEQFEPFAKDAVARDLSSSDDIEKEYRNTKYFRKG